MVAAQARGVKEDLAPGLGLRDVRGRRGKGNPTWATVRDIAAALGVSVSELAKAAESLEE